MLPIQKQNRNNAQKFKTVDRTKSYSGSKKCLSCLISVVVDCASFKTTPEMTEVKNFDCQLQISKSATPLHMSVKFYAVLSLSLCMVLILYSFAGPLPDQSLKKSSNFFFKSIKDTQITVLQ